MHPCASVRIRVHLRASACIDAHLCASHAKIWGFQFLRAACDKDLEKLSTLNGLAHARAVDGSSQVPLAALTARAHRLTEYMEKLEEGRGHPRASEGMSMEKVTGLRVGLFWHKAGTRLVGTARTCGTWAITCSATCGAGAAAGQ